MYIDFHTHKIPTEKDVVAVVDGRDTWGIHPWRTDCLSTLCSPKEKEETEPLPSGESWEGALAIGECGLDALRGPSMEVQEAVFRKQVALSERIERPLIVHCVKAIDRLLRIRKELKPTQLWMLHGFRGKPQQLRSLLDAGFYVSFGFNHNDESLRICPINRMLLETDTEEGHSIQEIYNNVAQKKGLDVPTLCELMAENYRAFFQNEPLVS